MFAWTAAELKRFAALDDLHVSPFRADGVTYGTPTFIGSVVADGNLYIRPYYGSRSRWYQAALQQGAGRVRIGGEDLDVHFAPAGEGELDAVDAAYQAKYAGSPYLASMVAAGPRGATIRVVPDRACPDPSRRATAAP